LERIDALKAELAAIDGAAANEPEQPVDDLFARIKRAVDDLLNDQHQPDATPVVNEPSPPVNPSNGSQPITKQPSPGITHKQVAAALRFCDLQLEQLRSASQSAKETS
jgi:hypothetical protein